MREDAMVVYLKQMFKESLIFTAFTFLHLQIHRNFTCMCYPASSVFRHFEQQNLASNERHSYLIISLQLFRIAYIILAASLNVRKLRPRFVMLLEVPSEKTAIIDRKCVIGHTVRNEVWDNGNGCPLP
jgi:hypothetical protein